MPHVVGSIFKRSLSLVVCPVVVIVLASASAGSARAQEPAPPPAYIALVEGNATIEREGETTAAAVNMPLVPGDRVRTTAGRVEIRFPDGTGIEVAEFSAVELVTDTRVRLLAGSLDRLEPLQENVNAASASYLPQDLKMYGSTFDQYGSWRYAPDYGYVWYPMVAADWRPYHNGYWEPIRRYGWTWIGADLWAWPTHHYGRWGHAGGAWFWVPDRTFAAAWVSWGMAPGYVSWCPLGFDNRPVFALSVGGGAGWSGWTVVSRTHFGSRGYYANRYAVDPRQLPRQTTFVAQTTPAVAVPRHVTNGTPASAGVAVPRGDRGIRAGAAESRRSPVTVAPAVQPAAPIVIPPVVTGQPVRAGTWPSYQGRTTNEQRPTTNDQRPATNEHRRAGTASAPPPPAAQPQAAQPQTAQPQAAPQQNSNGGGGGAGRQRAGTTAQPRGGNDTTPNTQGGESRATARRRG